MARSLPPSPSVRFLAEEAKDLLKAQRRKDVSSCATLRLLHRFADAPDSEILQAEVALNEVQLALALDYGFASWKALIDAACAAGEATVFRDSRVTEGFRGDRLRQDTFSLAVAEALKVLGHAADYATVHLWSGNAFAPDIRPEEPTRSHWQLQGRERCLDVIAAGAGVRVRPFPDYHELAEVPPMPKGQAEEEAWLREYYAKPAASYLSHSLQAGEVVVSCGEWLFLTKGVLWCDWGLVVEARSDGTILGAAPNGWCDNLITHIRDGWILSAGATPSPPEEMTKRVLRRAVERIRGTGPAFRPGPRKVVFGLAAMDAWMDAMTDVPFDAEQWQGVDHSIAHARETALPTFDQSKAAAAYLRRLAEGLVNRPAGCLRDAAEQYDRIAALLAPAVADDGPQSYATIMGDEARQRDHVRETLAPVRAALEAAANCIEKALAAIE